MPITRASSEDSPRPQAFGRLPESFTLALRHWEPRRLTYNVVLAGFVVAWVAGTWPRFRPAMTWTGALQLAFFALLANLCYCAAYVAEMIAQPIARRVSRFPWRSVVWVLGTVLAVLLENYWIADEIYPFVR